MTESASLTTREPDSDPAPTLLATLQQQQWYVLDGQGGFGAGNVALLPRSLDQGMLVSATAPPVGRFVLLARLEETVLLPDGREIPLSTQRYVPDVVAPQGYRNVSAFSASPFPCWTYDLGNGACLEREIFSCPGHPLVGVVYRVSGGDALQPPLRLRVRPLLAFRRIDEPTFENPAARLDTQRQPGAAGEEVLGFALYDGLPRLYLSSPLAWQESPCWYKGFYYPELSHNLQREDLPSPGFYEGELACDGIPTTLLAATEPVGHGTWAQLRQEALERPARELERFPARGEGQIDSLIVAGSAFVASRAADEEDLGGGAGILHHLPDGTHDGRAALIGLRGLLLIPGRLDVARQLLTAIAEEYTKGMIPTRHDEYGGSGDVTSYDTLLWFPVAVYHYLLYTEDQALVRQLFWTLVEIGGQIQRGLPGLRMDRRDSLLIVGEDGRPHTWMNALYPDGEPVTLRRGKPVEINALWYNVCECLKEISAKLGRSDLMRNYRALAARIRETFPVAFWNPRARCLYDVVEDEARDEAIRPNQLLTLSLPFRLIEGDKAESVFRVCERELLTPCGLRTLSPRSPGYVGSEEDGSAGLGGPHLRHQGSVYPWLLGPFVSAAGRMHGGDVGFAQQVLGWMDGALQPDSSALPGQLRERYDGDAPHAPRGERSSALNVAELTRAFVEEVQEYPAFNMRPAGGNLG